MQKLEVELVFQEPGKPGGRLWGVAGCVRVDSYQVVGLSAHCEGGWYSRLAGAALGA